MIPNGRDAITGMTYDASQTVFPTVVYRRFTKGWKKPLRNSPEHQDYIPGPLLHARVGDKLEIHFKNEDTVFNRPHSMHFHGVRYKPSSDGAYLPGFSGPDADVKPGKTWTYKLTATNQSVGVWPYHDHSPSMDDSIAGGMYGALSILGRHQVAPDREFVVVFAEMGQFQTIDGRAFVGNTPVFHSWVGDLVQWDVLAMGSEHHTFHVHGHRWVNADGRDADTQTVGPAESFEIRWREEDPGTWLYHCHVEQHMMQGMIGIYRVARGRRDRARPGRLRRVRPHADVDPLGRHGDVDQRGRPRAHRRLAQRRRLRLAAVLPRRAASRTPSPAPGAYPYYCRIHPFMRGEVDVYDSLLDAPTVAAGAGRPFVLRGRTAQPAGTTLPIVADDGSTAATATVGADGEFSAAVTPRGHHELPRARTATP